jgi:hypothetical protein
MRRPLEEALREYEGLSPDSLKARLRILKKQVHVLISYRWIGEEEGARRLQRVADVARALDNLILEMWEAGFADTGEPWEELMVLPFDHPKGTS